MIMVFSRPPYYDPREPHTFLPTVQLIEAIRPHFETAIGVLSVDSDNSSAANARIQKALNQRLPMRFPDDTTLEEVATYIQRATRGSDGRVIPIYIDPIGLQEAEKSMTSTVRGFDLEGVRLRTSLRLWLRQLDLAYVVKDGLLLITSRQSEDNELIFRLDDPFQILGHCMLALIAAALGGAAAPLVCDLARQQRG